jgi:FlaA1/EpsC-like NDP-sugar epimerase
MENVDNSSPVQDFFRGKNIFITGATGFLGMALIEKLLRVCPDVGTIYVLVRPKKGKEVSARLEELIKNPVSTKLGVLIYCILGSCYISFTLNICSFVHQCNIHFLLFIIRRHVSASHGHLQV